MDNPNILLGLIPFFIVISGIFLKGKLGSIGNFFIKRKKDKEIFNIKKEQINNIENRENQIHLKIKMNSKLTKKKKEQVNVAVEQLQKRLQIIDSMENEENIQFFKENW